MLLLFLDDWFLDRRVDVRRVFPEAKFTRCIWPPKSAGQPPRATWNPARGCYEAPVGYGTDRPVMKESADGVRWSKGPRQTLTLEGPEPEGCRFDPHALFFPGDGFDMCGIILDDVHDPDPGRRYKRLFQPFVSRVTNVGGIEGGPGIVAYSADGIHWTARADHVWYRVPKGSDTVNSIIYHPGRKVWQAICRRCNCDRRIAMAESSDLAHWTAPRVILHPDALDPALLQFYGMAVTHYEGYLLGAVQRYHVPQDDLADPRWAKMSGRTDGELAYSYDGQSWVRSARTPLVSPTAPDLGAGSCVYPTQWRSEPGRMILGSLGTAGHHSMPTVATPRVEHELRQDGLAYLEPTSGCGTVILRALAPAGKARLSLNVQATGGGHVTARVLEGDMGTGYGVVPGYDFADCVPVGGDQLQAPLRWRDHADLRALAGRRVRIELRFTDVKLYAVRTDCKLWYTNTPEPVEWVG